MIKYITLTEYNKLWEDLKTRMQFTSPNIDPIMKNMSVQGLSGPDYEFKNEYDRLVYKHYNPDPPRFITMIGIDGEERIYPEVNNGK